MATCELIFRVGDAAEYPADPMAGRDGAVILMRGRGYAWGPATINAYLNNGTVPPNWTDLSPVRRQWIKRMLDRTIRWTEPGLTPADVADVRDPGWDQLPQVDQDALLAHYSMRIGKSAGLLFQLQTYGYDTNWTLGELQNFGVACVDLTDDQILHYYETVEQRREVTPTVDDLLDPIYHAKNWYRVKYETFLSQAEIDAIADTSIVVPVKTSDRNTPRTVASTVEEF